MKYKVKKIQFIKRKQILNNKINITNKTKLKDK